MKKYDLQCDSVISRDKPGGVSFDQRKKKKRFHSIDLTQ